MKIILFGHLVVELDEEYDEGTIVQVCVNQHEIQAMNKGLPKHSLRWVPISANHTY